MTNILALDKSVNKDNFSGSEKKEGKPQMPKNTGRLFLSIKCKLSGINNFYVFSPCR